MRMQILFLEGTDKISQVYHLYYYLRGFPYLDSSFFWFKNALIPLCLSKDKIKEQSGKNATLTPTKTFPKK